MTWSPHSQTLVLVLALLSLPALLVTRPAGAQTAYFDETTDVIQVDGQTTIGTTWTYEAVILFPNSGGAYGRVFNEWTSFQEDKLLQIGPNYIQAYNYNITNILQASPAMMPDVWHHVAYVSDGAEERLYLDGQLIAVSAGGGDAGDGGGLAHVGAIFRDGGVVDGFTGYLESLRISDVARYTGSSFASPTGDLSSDANTQLLFNFNEPFGASTVQDESPLARTGTPGIGFDGATPPDLGVSPPQATCSLAPSNQDLWNVSREITVTASSGFLSGNLQEGTNIFGGSFSTNEPGAAFFRDDQQDGFTHFVEWETPSPVTANSFYLRANHDQGLIRRAFRTFRLYGYNASTQAFDLLYTLNPPLPYGGGVDENILSACANVPELTTNRFRAEFVQEGSGSFYGPRVVELDAFSTPVAMTGSIEGVVSDASGTPLQGASVLIDQTNASTVTDAQGYFNFPSVDPATYSLSFSLAGFDPVTVDNVEVVGGGSTLVEVSLSAATNETDRDALMALYNSTGGDNWTNNTNWGSAEPISEWFGVTEAPDRPGSVGTLRLIGNNLLGPLPPAWESMIQNDGALAFLTVLDLSDNILTGSVPAWFGGMTSLQELHLAGNLLQGELTAELTTLESLGVLNLADNGLGGDITSAVASMPSLRELNIRTNFFENLADLTSSSSLTTLTAHDNFFQFDDIEPNLPITNFSYSPQNGFGAIQSPTVQEGGSLTLSYSVGGSNNQYQWFLNSSPIDGATADTYDITNASTADEGFYVLQVTNPNVPDLVLSSNGIFVNVSSGAVQGEFVVTNTNDSGDGSLRAAILAANANPNEQGFLDEITFNISGTGPHVIRPLSALPVITESVSIDGTTQSGAACGASIAERDLRIVLDGSDAGGVEGGLVFRDNENTALVTGLVINNFSGAGILVDGTPLLSLQCSFIGTDVTGSSAAPNIDGIHATNSNNVLIGSGSGQTGNLISGNSGYGVRINGQGQAGGSVLYGNLIGTDRTGMTAVPNSVGVLVENGGALIGAPGEFESNVISGNSARAVEVRGQSSAGTFLTNNFIGTGPGGTQPVPNGEGILIHDGASGVIVGFFTDTNDEGYANLIAYNNGPGVTVTGASTTGNRISANRMFENTGLGIDLGDDGLNTNDIGDADEGPNRLLNSPQIVSSSIDGSGDLVVSYLVESDGSDALRIEFFGADADGEEGAFILGSDTYFLNEAGQTVQVNLGNAASLGISDPNAIVATSTDSFGNTSEFSGAGSGPGGGTEFVVTEPDDVEAVSGGNVPVQASVPTGFNATVREVCYRRTGEAEFSCTQLQVSGSAFQGSIPSSFVTERGVQYYFRFSDGATETTVPANDPENSAFVLPVRVDGLRAGGTFAPDTYRMISVPVDLADASVSAVLDEYGAVNPNRWRLLRWQPTLESYVEYPDLTNGFDPCEAYWLITFDGGDFEVDNGQSVNPTEPCFVTVRPGWNQFGSPYAFPVAWTDVDVSGAVDGPVLYDASAGDEDPYVYDAQVLEPWQGYWLFNPGTQNVFMSFNPIEAVGKAGKSDRSRHLAGDEYEIGLRASLPAEGLVDNRNHVGLTPRASDGFDGLDFAEAPPIGDHVRLSILEDGRRLAGSFRTEDGGGQTWDLRITGDVDGRPARGVVRVSLEEFGRRPSGFNLRVVDLDEALPVRLDENEFDIELTDSRSVRNLRLILGTPAFSDEAGGSIPEVPQRAHLSQNYPNPFNPSTRIRYQVHVDGPVEVAVFDPLGRRIRTLVSANHDPGWYDTVWNGRDDSGTGVPSGIYFYVLKTIDGSESRTMVLLR